MVKKNNQDELPLSLVSCFPKLYKFGIQWKDIVWRNAEEFSNDSLFSEDNVLIKSVAGFTNPYALRKFINDLCLEDFISLRNMVKKKPATNIMRSLENLIGEAEDFKFYVVAQKPQYQHFLRWIPTEEPKTSHDYPEETILRNSEGYTLAFLKSLNELITKLNYLKSEIEISEVDKDPLTFDYVGSKGDLTNLFDALSIPKFINKDLST